jgi:hypothetical protein
MLRDDLFPLDLPPGVVRNGTQYQVKGRWYDSNLVRWVDGQMRPVGGWQKVSGSAMTGYARDMVSWADNSGTRWIAIGTNTKLYVTRGDSVNFDITPVGFTQGEQGATESFGYGGGDYGEEAYGTQRSGGTFVPMALWSLDTWGQYLVGCARQDGKIYEWTLNTGNKAVAITNAPTGCIGILVTDQRHILALGASGNPRRIEWCDKEANTIWTPSSTNEAGGFELQTASAIKAGVRVAKVNLILTRTDAHVVQYIGQPFIYSRNRVGAEGCGTPCGNSLVSVESEAFWMGDGQFWYFDGASVNELPCDVSAHVFNDINKLQIEKVVAGHNPKFNEVWWFYPQNGSDEPDRYVAYNYKDKFWMIGSGTLNRIAWEACAVFGNPHAVGTDKHIYRQEDDWTANGSARYPSIYAESGALELGVGARIAEVSQLIPDEEQSGDVSVSFKVRYTPNGQEYTKGPYLVRSDGYTDARFSARQAAMRITPTADEDWSIGTFRINAAPGARR